MCCWTRKYENERPNDNTEVIDPKFKNKDTHCHGSAWSKTGDDSDIQWKYREEIFNQVVCEDHGFQRGYWQGIKKKRNNRPHLSCGCVEDMPLVTRSDCGQANEAEAAKGNYQNQACQGDTPNDLRSWYEKINGNANGLTNPVGEA